MSNNNVVDFPAQPKFKVGDRVRLNEKGRAYGSRRAEEIGADGNDNFKLDATKVIADVGDPDMIPAPGFVLVTMFGFDDEDIDARWYNTTDENGGNPAAVPETHLELANE